MPKVIVVPFCVDLLYRTDGTTNWLVDIVEPPELRELGPMISKLRVHYAADAATAAFKARVTMAWSVLGRNWSTPVEIFAPQTGVKPGTIGTWYSTDDEFGLLLRFAVEVANASGTAQESARLTVFLHAELKS